MQFCSFFQAGLGHEGQGFHSKGANSQYNHTTYRLGLRVFIMMLGSIAGVSDIVLSDRWVQKFGLRFCISALGFSISLHGCMIPGLDFRLSD